MSTITITLRDSLSFRLTQIFAEEIHAELIRRHLRRIGYADRHDIRHGNFAEVCRALRSIPDDGRYGARREFVLTLKFVLRAIMKEKHTEPRWQTYVQSVARIEGMPAPADVNDPAWETFVLKQPHRSDIAA